METPSPFEPPTDVLPSVPSGDLLLRYCSGETLQDERLAVQQWLRAHPEHTLRLTAASYALHYPIAGTRRRDEKVFVDRVVRELRSMTASGGVRTNARLSHDQSSRAAAAPSVIGAIRRWRIVAAAVVGALVLLVSLMPRNPGPAQQGSSRRYVTHAGERLTLRLPDGSRITLAPQSQLLVPMAFGRSSRTVHLDGQAYVAVVAGAGTPFVVATGSVVTRVLGTAFDVRHYAGDANVRVAVIAGKVAVSGTQRTVTLAAGHVGYVTDSTATSAVPDDLTPYTTWKEGRLVFRGSSIGAMLSTLGRWYGYDFRLADSTLARQDVTVTFDANDTRTLFATLRHVLGVSVQVDGTIVTLTPDSSAGRSFSPPSSMRRTERRFRTPSPQLGR